MGQNRVEKITERYSSDLDPGHKVRSGDFVKIRPFHVMTHDNTGAVIPKFESLGATKVRDSAQPVFALDHDVQNKGEKNLAKYQAIEAFAAKHGIAFHGAGFGIGHQIMVEEGFALPGTFVVASDSHSNIYGAVAALGTPVVRTDAAAIWATGETWWQVPPVVRVLLEGELPAGVSGKDVIIDLIGYFNHDEVLNCAIEFAGAGLAQLSMDQRLTIANMTTEWGALTGLFPCDGVTRRFLHDHAERIKQRGDENPRLTAAIVERYVGDAPEADADAVYAKELEFDLSTVTPHVAGPDEVKRIVPVSEIEQQRVKIDRAYLLSCVGGRLEDIQAAAAALHGRSVAGGVSLYLAAASATVEEQARADGAWQTLLDAGAIALPPGCGACIGLGRGLLEPGEIGISATNRNFKGRMGSRDAQVYLASPAVVAASAAVGHIAAAASIGPSALAGAVRGGPSKPETRPAVTLHQDFPAHLSGRMLLLPKDNLNTDGIYGKDFTYKDDLSADEMAAAAMLNYDPGFQEIARVGDILVGGQNFGSGSSREQAATALKYRGIQLVIAASFSQTYTRNAFNNGFVVLECPALVQGLRERFAERDELTIDTGLVAEIDFAAGTIRVDGQQYDCAPLGAAAQELVVLGGLEALVRRTIGLSKTG